MRARSCAVLLLLTACVPAADDPAPKGGVGIVTVPTAASRGEPFVTSDGWTIRVESLAIQSYLVAVPDDGKEGGFGGTYLFLGSKPEQFVVRAVPQGRARTSFTLTTRYIGFEKFGEPDYGPSDHNRVEPAVAARFDLKADDAGFTDGRNAAIERGPTGEVTLVFVDGPAVILVARAEKAGRVVRLDVGLAGYPGGPEIPVDVHANELSTATLGIAVEKLFTRNGLVVFDDLARADTNLDGELSTAELQRFDVGSCMRCDDETRNAGVADARSRSMAAVLGARLPELFVAQ